MTELGSHVVLKPRRRSMLTTVAITFLILLGLAMALSYMMWDGEPDPDRPPIIVSTGSVIVRSGADWSDEGGNRYVEATKGKSLKSFSASTGVGIGGAACKIEGKTIVVTYGSADITFSRKRRSFWPWSKEDAQVQFPSGATVNEPTAGELDVVTSDALVKFTNDKGDICTVGVDQRIEIRQVH